MKTSFWRLFSRHPSKERDRLLVVTAHEVSVWGI